jgi:hypothetical protein
MSYMKDAAIDAHNYDTMSVHELVQLLVDIDSQAMRKVAIEEVPAIESALRSAVIREASVGTLTCHAGMFGQTYGDRPITSFNEGDKYALVLLPKEDKNG